MTPQTSPTLENTKKRSLKTMLNERHGLYVLQPYQYVKHEILDFPCRHLRHLMENFLFLKLTRR